MGVWKGKCVLSWCCPYVGGGAGEQQVPRLRRMIRFANHSASLGMTMLGGAIDGTAEAVPSRYDSGAANYPATSSSTF